MYSESIWIDFDVGSFVCNMYLNPNYNLDLKLDLTVYLILKSSWLMEMLFHNQQGCWSRNMSFLSKSHLTVGEFKASVYVVIFISRLFYEPSAVVVDHLPCLDTVYYTKLCVIAFGLSDLHSISLMGTNSLIYLFLVMNLQL